MEDILKHLVGTSKYSAELLAMLTLVIATIKILGVFRVYGLMGLMCFLTMAYIATNIQVLHMAQYTLMSEPVALGTVLFATTFLVSDIITEHYGPDKARQAVGISFITQIGFTILMLITVAHPPLHNGKFLHAMEELFLPAPRLLIASLTAYLFSQLLDIWIFKKISDQTNKKHLWFRTLVSTSVSAIVDTVIFSVLAWVVLNPQPVTYNTLIHTYIIGTFIARLIVAALSTPIIYLTYSFLPHELREQKRVRSKSASHKKLRFGKYY